MAPKPCVVRRKRARRCGGQWPNPEEQGFGANGVASGRGEDEWKDAECAGRGVRGEADSAGLSGGEEGSFGGGSGSAEEGEAGGGGVGTHGGVDGRGAQPLVADPGDDCLVVFWDSDNEIAEPNMAGVLWESPDRCAASGMVGDPGEAVEAGRGLGGVGWAHCGGRELQGDGQAVGYGDGQEGAPDCPPLAGRSDADLSKGGGDLGKGEGEGGVCSLPETPERGTEECMSDGTPFAWAGGSPEAKAETPGGGERARGGSGEGIGGRLAVAAEAEEDDPRRTLWVPPQSPYNLLEEELYDDPWKVLVACILLNRTTIGQVRRVVWDLFRICPEARHAAAVDVSTLEQLLRPLGLFRKRAADIKRFSQEYIEKEWKDPLELHGIGKYAADAYQLFCRGRWREVIPIDRELLSYRDWLFSTGGLGEGLERIESPLKQAP
eukprot:evm.model.scf_1562.5 EVM.evm.TU.scf_1562.5   scf_1562:30486-34605(+)